MRKTMTSMLAEGLLTESAFDDAKVLQKSVDAIQAHCTMLEDSVRLFNRTAGEFSDPEFEAELKVAARELSRVAVHVRNIARSLSSVEPEV